MIFVDAYTTWCGPCKQMASKIFPLASVGSFYNGNFIHVKIDMGKGEGLSLANHYNVTAYPTSLFINSDCNLVHKATSYYESPVFISIGKDALDPNTQLYTLKEKFNKGTIRPKELYNLAIKTAEVSDRDAAKILDACFQLQTDWYSSKHIELMLMLINQENSPESPYYNFLVKNEAKNRAGVRGKEIA